jgi:chemotaxis family two-component system sensor kinase Cph1
VKLSFLKPQYLFPLLLLVWAGLQMGSRWWLLTEEEAPKEAMRDHLLLSGVLLAVLAVGLGLSIHFVSTRRIRWLAEEAARLKAGDVPREPLPGGDAIADLSRALSLMASRLGDLRHATDEHAIVAITDRQGIITFVNDKFCAISGYAREELIGKTHRIINSGVHPREFFSNMWQTISSGTVWRGEIVNRAKTGAHYYVATTIVPCPGADGKPEQYIAIRTDVTEQKAAAERLRVLTDELEAKNSDLEMLLHAASHDLRSPLVNVQGFASVIGDQNEALRTMLRNAAGGKPPTQEDADTLVSETADAVRFICAGAEKMDALLKGLLTFSRLGRAARPLQQVDAAGIVNGCLGAVRYQIEASGAKISVGPLPASIADPQLLDHTVSNLIDNSIKYRDPARPLEISISGAVEGDRCVYRFADNGIGIAPEHREKVFELFHRLDPRRNNSHGLGLAIVRRAMDRMNGSVAVEATPGGGTAFILSLKSGKGTEIPAAFSPS